MRRVAYTNSSNVTLYNLNRRALTQQFYFDEKSKTIKSNQWKHLSLSMSGNNLMTQSTNSRWFQLFRWESPHLANERGKVMDVSGG